MFRWQTELTAAGLPARRPGRRGRRRRGRLPAARRSTSTSWPASCSAPGGRLASEKTFTRGDVIVAVAPHLHGLPVAVLDQAVEAVLAHTDAVRLPAVRGAQGAGVGRRLRAGRRGAHRRAGRDAWPAGPAPRCTGARPATPSRPSRPASAVRSPTPNARWRWG